MKFHPLFRFLIRIPAFVFVLLFLAASIITGIITTFLPEPTIEDPFTIDNKWVKIIFSLIIVPLIETLLFQSLIIEIVCKFIKRPRHNLYVAIILSAFAFAFSHTYSISYVVFTFVGGLILAFAYYIGRYRRENAFLLVVIIHALYNLWTILLNVLV